ncbi:hypothetical protein [Actinomadura alba]|uniref:Uncharacterized protein n=1 Tax=Actinomadura alba TaxID=406431 RepID=A0ABR7M2W6_9ACTN|nr:hypothetical protein [Actinomadura alba]MBC6471273.1 hypothetical protein [Actinomadura alba]
MSTVPIFGSESVMVYCGALRLKRMLPVLEVAATPFLEEIEEIIDARGEGRASNIDGCIDSISSWMDRIGIVQDIDAPEWFQDGAAEIALASAGVGDVESRARLIQHATGNFWNACDDIVHRIDGYRSPEFTGLKTTLRGVEDIWQSVDLKVIRELRDSREAFRRQVASIGRRSAQRSAIAGVIARCAGWEPRTST